MDKENLYFVETWPEIQNLMECEGFEDNCFLINDDKGYEKFGDSAYFVNLSWYESIKDDIYINS